jgi:hypothetical protein
MNLWVNSEESVHPVLKQIFWRVSVWFECKRQINRWSERRIIRCWRGWLLPNPKASDEPLPIPSVHWIVSFEFFGRWTHPTNVKMMASVHPMLWLEFQLIHFKRLWVFRRFFCFNFASMNSLSWITSKELECAYFHGFWCMVKLLVHEPLLIVRSNTTN